MQTTSAAPIIPPVPDITTARRQHLINGEFRSSAGAKTFENLNPVTEEVIVELPDATAEEVDAAVRAARHQFDAGEWRGLSGAERGALLYRFADLLERDIERIAGLQALECGTPAAEVLGAEIPRAIGAIRYFAGWADKIEGRLLPTPDFMGHRMHAYSTRVPIGVIGAIVPWNAPVMIAAMKLSPALAAGCTAVLKAGEATSLTSLALIELLHEAGVPAGVVNVLLGHGHTTGMAMINHPGIDKITFTGSPETGRIVQRESGNQLKRVMLELGGKSPQMVFADADLDAAIAGIAVGLFSNQGQMCVAGSRILVERSLYGDVVDGLAEIAGRLRSGDPFDPETTIGALVSAPARDRVLDFIASGSNEGARLLTGGGAARDRGYFVEPTVFADASNDMRIAREEIFGPVGTVIPFDDDAEALAIANDTPYGLSAAVWTKDLSRAHKMAADVRGGLVWVNTWGNLAPDLAIGGFGDSGHGRENGAAAIEQNTEEKVVAVAL